MGPEVVCHHCGRMRPAEPYLPCGACGATRPTGDLADATGAPPASFGGPASPAGFGAQPAAYPPPPASSSSTKWIVALVAFVGLCGVFSCCTFVGAIAYLEQSKPQQSSVYGQGPSSPSDPSIAAVESSDRLIVMPPYGGLTATTSLHAEAQIQLQNLPAELYVLGFSEPKSAFAPGFTLDAYRTSVAEGMAVQDKVVSAPSRLLVGGRDGQQVLVHGTLHAMPIVYWVVLVESEQHFHQLVVWTLAAREADHAATVNRILTETIVRSSP